jgi:lysozyme
MHEGFRAKPYYCTAGKLSIGYGWNLEAFPMPEHIASQMLEYQLQCAENVVKSWVPRVWDRMGEARQGVLTEMVFQLGSGRCAGFKLMWAAVKSESWLTAATEMLDSKWARQDSPGRAALLAGIMESGDV